MVVEKREDGWSFNKTIPVSILVAQTIALVIWATKLDSRVEALETGDKVLSKRMAIHETDVRKMDVIADRQNFVLQTLKSNGDKIDALISEVAKLGARK